MLDFMGTVVIAAVSVVNVNAVISTLQVQRTTRLILAVAMGGWIGLAAASSNAGLLAVAQPFPLIGLFVATPLAIAALIVGLVPASRRALLALPMPLLIGLNFMRVLGGFFLLLAADGRMSGPFPYSAGTGDIITGVIAVPVIWYAVSRRNDSLIAAWNLFGAADLVVALTLGVASAPGPLQVFHAGVGSTAIQALPWAFIPTVLVPFYLITHAIVWAQLRTRGPARVDPQLTAAA